MPVPLDEYPVHQVPLSMRHMATSDRNAYDRCYFNAHDRTGEVFLVTGMGVYPNLGVIDAYATVPTRRRAVHGADVGRPGRRPHEPARRPLPHRGPRAPRAGARGVRGGGPRGRVRPHLDRVVPDRRGARARHAPGRPGHPRRLALRPGRHVVGGAPGRGRRAHGERRPLGRHPGPLVGHPARGRGRATRARRRRSRKTGSASGGRTCPCVSTTSPWW